MEILNLFKPNVEKMGRKRNVEGLVKALMYKDWRVRSDAAITLGNIGNKRAVEPLIQALKDEENRVREGTAGALGRIGWEPSNTEEKIYYLIAQEKWDKVAMEGGLRAAEEIINQLFTDPFHPQSSLLSSEVENLLGDYANLIFKASSGIKGDMRYKNRGLHFYNFLESNIAISKLCRISTQISNNILHKISKKKDVEITVSCDERMGYKHDQLSFESQREMAKDELKWRGNPPYDPSIYFNKEALKL